jgi:hypothetical protein
MDLYFYEARHTELLAFYRSLESGLSRDVLVGMIEQSRRHGGLSFDTLTTSGEKGKRVIVRLRVDAEKYPELVKEWQERPQNGRSPFFVARLQESLAQMKRGVLLSYSALQPGMEPSGGHVPPEAYVEHITIEAPKDESNHRHDDLPLDDAIVDGLTEMTSVFDDLLGSLATIPDGD